MFSPQPIANQYPGVYQRAVVDCEKCRSPILIRQPGMASLEFCVPCPKCGYRGMYFKRMIYNQDAAERREKPRD